VILNLRRLDSSDQTKYFLDRLWTPQPDIDIFITNYNLYGLDYYRDGEFGWRKEPDTLANRYIKDSNKIYS
jgi:hypothetical protein